MMYWSLFFGLLCAAIVCGLLIWVTRKAYSRKWDQDEDDRLS